MKRGAFMESGGTHLEQPLPFETIVEERRRSRSVPCRLRTYPVQRLVQRPRKSGRTVEDGEGGREGPAFEVERTFFGGEPYVGRFVRGCVELPPHLRGQGAMIRCSDVNLHGNAGLGEGMDEARRPRESGKEAYSNTTAPQIHRRPDGGVDLTDDIGAAEEGIRRSAEVPRREDAAASPRADAIDRKNRKGRAANATEPERAIEDEDVRGEIGL
jgi:hypothetical protein